MFMKLEKTAPQCNCSNFEDYAGDTQQMVKQKPRITRREHTKNQQEDWTLVKKQKITILIPPLPSIGEDQLQANPANCSSQSYEETRKSKSLSPKPCNLAFQKPSGFSNRTASDNSPPCGEGKGKSVIFCDGSAIPDRRMRASYLEKKLKRAGGLENWLLSHGLGHFVRVFRARSVNKFQLANLTMKKLKDMGTEAVGPRRKLMHAIDCLCEPHCFLQFSGVF
ncbi:sterile alpha motif (SAM) domain-containing protein [Striga asiatica]|uniref:Sterile alpha motif (SAM) domain-containing protein n=1 Tax=Striga asiatica TaxID=4170 RepID=A0A5A7P2L1_STRAF|nr:sterile alpha motif (SAM) domain-containing protein [Striga asiatica]